MTVLPALAPAAAAGFAAGTLLSAACLLLVLTVQRAGRQRADLPPPWRQRARLRAVRLRRTAPQRAGRTWPAQATVPPSAPTEDAHIRTPQPRGRGRHAAPAGGMRLTGRRRSRLLSTRD